MSNLMSDDVCCREFARCTKSIAEFLKKRSIQIDLPICRTVERSHCCLTKTTSGVDFSRINDQFGGMVCLALLLKDFGPGILRIAHDDSDELFSGVSFGV